MKPNYIEERNELFKALFTEGNRVKLIIDSETGKIIEANKAAIKFYGYTYEEFISMNIYQINTLSNSEVKKKMLDAKSSVKNRFFFKHRLKNGQIRDVEVNSKTLKYNGELYLYSDIEDVTKRNANAVALEKAQQSLNERVKALNAIYQLGVLEDGGKKIDFICNELVNKIAPSGLRFPEKVSISLDLEGKYYQYNFNNDSNKNAYVAPIYSYKRQVGNMQVSYNDENEHVDQYGQELINVLVERLSRIVENIEARIAIEESDGRILENTLKFKSLIDNSFDIMSIIDKNGIIKFESKAAKRLLDYKAGEKTGHNMLDYVHPDDVDTVKTALKQLDSIDKRIEVFQFRYKHKNGSWRWFETNAQNFVKNPYVNGIIVNKRDITEQRLTEEALKESEEKYRLIAENVTDVIWVLNLNRQKYTYISPSIRNLRGITVEEALSEKLEEGLAADSYQEVTLIIERYTKRFIADPETFTQKIIKTELKVKNKIGDFVWVEASTRLRYNRENEIEIVGVSRKIEDRKQQEQRILHRLKYEESISLCSSALLLRSDDALEKSLGYILKASEASRVRIVENYNDEELKLCMRISNEICAENVDPLIPVLQNIQYEKAGFERWLKFLSANEIIQGNAVDFPANEMKVLEHHSIKSILVIPLWVNMEWYGYIAFDDVKQEHIWDDEDLKMLKTVSEMIGMYIENNKNQSLIVERNKQLAQLNATKDKFLSIVAHDLKSPFASILGFSELLVKNLHKYDQEKVMKFVQAILNSSNSAYRLVDNLLEWARSQSGKIEYNPENLNLKNLLSEVVLISENAARAKQISLNLQMEDETLKIHADRNMVNAILRNLISNAIKFTNRNGAVSIKAKVVNREVEISVSDNGVGIGDDMIGKLFKINEKVSSPGTEHEIGTGLGLLLCKEFVDRHHGRIWVESEVNSGSIFNFTLPVSKV